MPSDKALSESIDVLDRTIANGGLKEESSLVMNNGTVVKGQTGSLPEIKDNMQTARASLPDLPAGVEAGDVEVSIHSHPTEVQEANGSIYPQSASTPSPQDKTTFTQFGTNIIVGPLGTVTTATKNPNGTTNIPRRDNGAVIYRSGKEPLELKKSAIQKILK